MIDGGVALLKRIRMIVGGIVWVLFFVWIAVAGSPLFRGESSVANQVGRYLVRQPPLLTLEDAATLPLKTGDPVYVFDDGQPRLVGIVKIRESAGGAAEKGRRQRIALVQLFSSAPPIGADAFLQYYSTPDSLIWAVQTMLPAEKREEIATLIFQEYQRHQGEIARALGPIIRDAAIDVSGVIRDEFAAAWARREQQINEFAQRMRREKVEPELIPLLQREVWPVVERESTPLADEIARELWDEVSVWAFGWSILVDQIQGTEGERTQREFDRFLKEKALPILREHIPDMLEVQNRVIRELLDNPAVTQGLREFISDMVRDPEFQALATEIFVDVFVDNERLQTVINEHWNRPEMKEALQVVNQKLEPAVTKIGAILFGSPTSEITPEFARVLRSRIMFKDRRWLVLFVPNEATESDAREAGVRSLPVRRGPPPVLDPFFPELNRLEQEDDSP